MEFRKGGLDLYLIPCVCPRSSIVRLVYQIAHLDTKNQTISMLHISCKDWYATTEMECRKMRIQVHIYRGLGTSLILSLYILYGTQLRVKRSYLC